MKYYMVKYLRWFIAAGCVIYAFHLLGIVRDYNTIKPVFPVIVLLGIAGVLSVKAYDEPKVIIVVSIGLMIVTAFLASIIPLIIPVFGYSYSVSWALWTFAAGLPVMIHVFKKYE